MSVFNETKNMLRNSSVCDYVISLYHFKILLKRKQKIRSKPNENLFGFS